MHDVQSLADMRVDIIKRLRWILSQYWRRVYFKDAGMLWLWIDFQISVMKRRKGGAMLGWVVLGWSRRKKFPYIYFQTDTIAD